MLTTEDVQRFADTARAAVERSRGQVAQLRKGFPNITNADVGLMRGRIAIDPTPTGEVDVAAYYLALHMMAYIKAQSLIDELTSCGTPGTLSEVLLTVTGCSDIVNALTLLQAGGGLATQLHLEEAQVIARRTVASKGGSAKHAKGNEAKLWVQQQWNERGAEYKSKKAFAGAHVSLVKARFNLEVKDKTITDDWLSPSATTP